MTKKALNAFEHQVLHEWRQYEVKPSSLMIGVSGGMDSVVLLHVLKRLKRLLRVNLLVAHVHHGPARTQAVELYRTRALAFVQSLARQWKLPFISNVQEGLMPALELSSEAELRLWREQCFQRWLPDGGILALGHNQDDLLETQLMRALRGTSAFGIGAMQVRRDHKFRPLLQFSRVEIQEYAQAMSLSWLEDPTNSSLEPLRNWLRHEWLARLEERLPGAKSSLSRSMSQLAESLNLKPSSSIESSALVEGKISRLNLIELQRREQQKVLAQYLRQMNLSNYSKSHIEEILKRLDTSRKNFTFPMLKCVWQVTPQWIKASRV